MRQVLQSLADGRTILAEVPGPRAAGRGGVVIATKCTLISAGTERMLVDFGRGGWISKARQQPEKVRQVIDKVRTDGFLPTLEAVRSKLDQPLPLGYCNVGVVEEVGQDVAGITIGDRVVSNGPHAQRVIVPRNLCARIPAAVSDEEAAFAVMGAIALQGIRLAAPTLGERFVVTGLGLIGLITVQLLRANGCRVLGIDPDPAKAALARSFGADVVALDRGEDVLSVAREFSEGQGVDGVLITAATDSNEPVKLAAQVCRKRGRIILVGVAGLALERADFYQKELSFQVSCSYGPGRYDPDYEEKGHDYPLGFVRWTLQRNFESVLDMMAAGRLDVKPLISHRFNLDAASAAYELLASGAEPYLGILLVYPAAPLESAAARTIELKPATAVRATGSGPRVAFVGAGNYAGRVLIPAFAAAGAGLQVIASGGGVSAAHYGRKFGFSRASSDAHSVIAADDVDIVVVATRHNTHAAWAVEALAAGKHVFVEKPLALSVEELDAIEKAQESSARSGARPLLMVGFNRRFAPQVQRMKALLAGVREPKGFVVTVNAGAIPATHWTQDPVEGGGRIVGEACHFVDLLRFLAGAKIVEASILALADGAATSHDTAVLTLGFADGSWGSINYLANGSKSYPKERVEVFCAGRVLQLQNFRRLRGYGWPGFRSMNLWRQDKGQKACVRAFVDAVSRGSEPPIPLEEIMEVSRVAIALGSAAGASGKVHRSN